MCRHLAYIGPPVTMHDLLFDAPHALVHQARSPRLQNAGNDNPHGWGVAWDAPSFTRYRSVTPMWQDRDFATDTRAAVVLAAARYASPGSAFELENVAPFVADGWAFSLNGVVRDFHAGFGEQLRAQVSAARVAALAGDTDAEVLFAMVRDRLDDGESPGEALATVTRFVRAHSNGALNLLLTDGHRIAATAVDNSLFVRVGDGILVASEPLDDDTSWLRVDNGSLVENDRVTPIPGLAPTGEPS
jgi:glutamine amidotransferase